MEDRRSSGTTANTKWMWAIAPIPDVIPGKLNMNTQLYGKCQRWRNCLANATSQSKLVLHKIFFSANFESWFWICLNNNLIVIFLMLVWLYLGTFWVQRCRLFVVERQKWNSALFLDGKRFQCTHVSVRIRRNLSRFFRKMQLWFHFNNSNVR